MPASPASIIFPGPNEKAAASPNVPTAASSSWAPRAWAQSSTIAIPLGSADRSVGTSAGIPNKCVATRPVTRSSQACRTRAGLIVAVARPTSTYRGMAPIQRIASVAAGQSRAEVRT